MERGRRSFVKHREMQLALPPMADFLDGGKMPPFSAVYTPDARTTRQNRQTDDCFVHENGKSLSLSLSLSLSTFSGNTRPSGDLHILISFPLDFPLRERGE